MQLQIFEGPPRKVNDMLKEGSVDISPSSSVVYLENRESLAFIPGHSISSKGPVRSIILVAKKRIDKIKGPVALSPESETSNLLLKVILNSFYDINPVFIMPEKQSLDNGISQAEAVLLIGDEALKVWMRPPEGLFIYDLGELWFQETGLPAVFALWIYRRELEEKAQFFGELLSRAKAWSQNNYSFLAKVSPMNEVFGQEALIKYWQGLSYDLEDEHLRSLETFNRYINELQESS